VNLNLPQEGAPEKKSLQRIAMYEKWPNLIVLMTTIRVSRYPLIVNRYPCVWARVWFTSEGQGTQGFSWYFLRHWKLDIGHSAFEES